MTTWYMLQATVTPDEATIQRLAERVATGTRQARGWFRAAMETNGAGSPVARAPRAEFDTLVALVSEVGRYWTDCDGRAYYGEHACGLSPPAGLYAVWDAAGTLDDLLCHLRGLGAVAD
jgi:hypothetical protein